MGGNSNTTPTCISNAFNANFHIPLSIKLKQFDGTNWSNWSETFKALLAVIKADEILMHATPPPGTDTNKWLNISRRVKAYLRLYIKPDVWSHIALDADYPTVHSWWEKLKQMYGTVSSSTSVFNLWIALTQTHLDDTQPMAPQLMKLNEV